MDTALRDLQAAFDEPAVGTRLEEYDFDDAPLGRVYRRVSAEPNGWRLAGSTVDLTWLQVLDSVPAWAQLTTVR